MILTIDVGNTNLKIGGWDGDKLAFVYRFETNPLTTSDGYALLLSSVFGLTDYGSSQVDGAIISCVVPQISSRLEKAVRKVVQISDILLVSNTLKTGLEIKIENPHTLGSDLICAGVGAINNHPLPSIVLGLGTAVTVFAINKKRQLLGGALAPGIAISLDALSSGTAQLPYISLQNPKSVIGTNTVDSMTAGVVYGYAGMIDGLVGRAVNELGWSNYSVIANGGFARLITPYCKTAVTVDDNLILQGLRILYYNNK